MFKIKYRQAGNRVLKVFVDIENDVKCIVYNYQLRRKFMKIITEQVSIICMANKNII